MTSRFTPARAALRALALVLAVDATAHAASHAKSTSPAPLPPPPAPAAPPTAHAVSTTSAPVASSASPVPDRVETSTSSSSTVDTRIVVAPLLGFATDDLNLGVGVRAGRMFTDRIYVGGTFVYHFGKSVDTTAAPGYSASASLSAFYVGPEAGYDFALAPVLVRAYAGLGLAALMASSSAGGVSVSNTDTKFVFWPGATVLYDLPDSPYFVGADARLLFIPGGPSLGVFALAGTRF